MNEKGTLTCTKGNHNDSASAIVSTVVTPNTNKGDVDLSYEMPCVYKSGSPIGFWKHCLRIGTQKCFSSVIYTILSLYGQPETLLSWDIKKVRFWWSSALSTTLVYIVARFSELPGTNFTNTPCFSTLLLRLLVVSTNTNAGEKIVLYSSFISGFKKSITVLCTDLRCVRNG